MQQNCSLISILLSKFRKGASSTVPSSNDQSGNIFFTLFGAVAIVGLLGTVIVSTMRGPLTTMVEVQTRTQAESEMAIASRLALLEATQQSDNGDCDSDGFVEPLEYTDASGAGPTGGGFLPNEVASSRVDPWGIEYGYCAWDAGGTTNALACDTDGGGTNERLDGNGSPTDETYTVIAIISAGPDQVFNTTCVGGGSPAINKSGDDIVTEFTYAAARGETGGLWNLKSGDPTVAEIDKSLEVTGGASFTAGIDLTGSSSALQLGAASMLYPDETTLNTCNAANDGLIRINTTADPNYLQLCDVANGWVSVAGLGTGLWQVGTGDDIYYNTGTAQVGIGNTSPSEALDVTGNIAASNDITAGGNLSGTDISASGNTNLSGTLDVTGTTDLGVLNSTGAVDFDTTLNVDGAATLGSTLDAQGDISNSSGDVTVDDTLHVTGGNIRTDDDLIVAGQSDLQNGVLNSSGDLRLNDDVDITGALDAQGTISNSTGNVDIGDDTDISGALDVTGNIDGAEITASGDVNAGSTINVNGDQLGPALNCSSSQKLEWNNGTGWSCVTDLQGGSGGGVPALDDISDVDATSPADGDCIVYNNTSGDWENAPCAGTGAGIFEIVTNVARVKSTAGDYATDDFVFGSPQLGDDGDATHRARVFFDKSKAAFRAGATNGTEWDDANVGTNSVALGAANTASGNNSTALGVANTASGDNSTVLGVFSRAGGGNSAAIGLVAIADGNDSIALGRQAQTTGNNSFAFGLGVATGTTPVVSGASSFGIFMGDQGGVDITASNTMSIMGGSVAIGDIVATTGGDQDLELDVTGDIGADHYCDADGYNCTAASDLGGGLWTDLTGGRIHYGTTSANQVGVGTANPQTTLDVNGGLRVGSVSGGAAPTFMNLNDLGDVSAPSPADGDCIVYNNTSGDWENGSCANGSNLGIFEVVSNVVRMKSTAGDYTNDDFVFGSPQLDDDSDANHDARMFFDKSKGSFRAGMATGSAWNDTNIGTSASIGLGWNVTVSGETAIGIGDRVTASSPDSVGIGRLVTSSADRAFAIGNESTASADDSYAIGNEVITSGQYSMGLGLGDPTGVHPTVSGTSSLGIFLGDQSGVDLTDSNTFSVMGASGGVGIGTLSPNRAFSVAPGAAPLFIWHSTSNTAGIGTSSDAWNARMGANSLQVYHDDFTIDTGFGDSVNHTFTVRINTSDRLIIDDTDVVMDGTGALTLTRGTTAERPGTPVNGMIRYNATINEFEGYENGAWVSIGGGSSLWTDNTTHITREDLHVINTASDSTSAGLDGVGTYSFYAANKSALRGGEMNAVDNTAAWQDTNIGNNSFAWGRNVDASGDNSAAFGQYSGAGGDNSLAFGSYVNAGGYGSFTGGHLAQSFSTYGFTYGDRIWNFGERTAAFGLGVLSVNDYPDVGSNGDESFVVFLGDQNSVLMDTPHTFGIFGGSVVIDPAQPSTQMAPRASLDVGAATDAFISPSGTTAQRPGTAVNGMIRYNSENNEFEGYENSAWVSIGGGTSLWTDNTTHITRENLHILNTGTTLTAAGFGSHTGTIIHPTQQAMRVGQITSGFDDDDMGLNSFAYGYNSRADGDQSVAGGSSTIAYGTRSMAFGFELDVVGTTSFGFKAGNSSTGQQPNILANDSFIIMMGAQNDVDPATDNTVGIFGGTLVIDPKDPATQLSARSVLDIGAATDSIVLPSGTTAQRPSTAVNGMIRYNSENNEFEGYENSAWVSIGGGTSLWTDNTTHITREDVHILNTGSTMTAAGFDGVSVDGVITHTDKRALRTGNSDNGAWNEANIGSRSFGAGKNPWATATDSIAMGWESRATAGVAIAMGSEAYATGENSLSFGRKSTASGRRALAIGLGDATGTAPVVSGDDSLGIFMGDQSGVDITNANTMAIMGGNVGIGNATPSATLSVVGEDGISGTPNASRVLGVTGGNGYASGNGDGGDISLNSGDGSGTGNGGAMTIRSGDPTASGGNGGNITIHAGEDTGTAGTTGGSVTIEAGNSRTPGSSDLRLYGGGYGDTSPNTTRSYIFLQDSGSTLTGSVTISGGGGTGLVGNTGNITIQTQSGYGDAGDINLTAAGGSTTSGNPGTINLTAGDAGRAGINGADIVLTPGNNGSGASDGNIILGSSRGNVGIGTVSPATLLHVDGVTRLTDINSSSNDLEFYASGRRGYIDSWGGSGALGSIEVGTYSISSVNKYMYLHGDSGFGFGTRTPRSSFDIVATDALITPSGTTAERPSTGVNGMIRYNATTNKFEAYENSAWTDMIGGGSSLWTDNTTHITRTNSHIINSGETMVTAGFDGTTPTGMIYYSDLQALRLGVGSFSRWDEANIGSRSFATGSAEASGSHSVGMGQSINATGNFSFAVGDGSQAGGTYAVAMGGGGTTADGVGSFAAGYNNTASGLRAIAMGNETTTTGDYSAALGLGDATGTAPIVSGANSLGVFIGDQSGVNMSDTDTVSFLGATGGFGIGTVSPDETLTINASDADFSQYSYGNTPQHIFYRANGTEASPSGVSDGDYIGLIDFYGHQSGAGYNNAAYMGAVADGNADVGQVPMALVFGVAYNFGAGKLAQEKLRIDKNGRFGFKDRDADAQYEFSLDGSTAIPFFMISTDDDNDGDVLYIGSNSDASFGGTGGLNIHNGTTAERPSSPDNGTIRYNSTTNKFEAYENSAWTDMIGGGSSLWTDNTTHITRANSHILNSGETMTTAGFDGGSGDGFVYHSDKQSLRVGTVPGTQWNESNIGNQSVAIGSTVQASGNGSVAMGGNVSATNYRSIALGDSLSAGGINSVSIGRNVTVSGDNAFGFGLGTAAGTDPIVSGNSSLGIFLGDQSGVDLTQTNAVSIMGGDLGIGTVTPASALDVNGSVTLSNPAGSSIHSTGNSAFVIRSNSQSNQLYLSPDGRVGIGVQPGQDLHIQDAATAALRLDGGVLATWDIISSAASGADDLTVSRINGTGDFVFESGYNIGIGTISPAEMLQVEGTALFRDCTYINRKDLTDQCGGSHYTFATKGLWENQILHTSGGDGNSSQVILAEGDQSVHRATFGFHPTTNIAFLEADAADLILIPNSGNNVGIGSNFHDGTDTVESMLHIQSGDIRLDGGAGNEAGCLRFNDTTDQLEYSDDCSTFNALSGVGGASVLTDLTDAYTDYTTDHNFILGRASASALTTGAQNNTFIGEDSGATTGNSTNATDNNTAIGYEALSSLTTGSNNTAIGSATLRDITTAVENTAIGYAALQENTTGNANTAIGDNTLDNNTTGSENTAIGRHAGFNTTTETQNTFIGTAAGLRTEGDRNVVIGNAAQAGSGSISTDRSVIIGDQAGQSAPLSDSVAIGSSALHSGSGDAVIAIGRSTGSGQTGNNNIFIGEDAGDDITGSDNIIIGNNATTPLLTSSNHLNIGDLIYGDMANNFAGVNVGTPLTAFHIDYAGGTGTTDPAILRLNNTTSQGSAKIQMLEDGDTAVNQGFEFEYFSASDGSENYLLLKAYPNSTTPDDIIRIERDGSQVTDFRQGQVAVTTGGSPTLDIASRDNGDVATLGLFEDYDDTDPDGAELRYDGVNNFFDIGTGPNGGHTSRLGIDRDSGNVGIGDFSGGSDVIDSSLHIASGELRLDGGAGNEAGCLRFDDTSDQLEYSNDCSAYSTFGGGSAVFEVSSNVVRGISGTVAYATDDFVFGSSQLADTGDANHDHRMFFDKSKGAFRAGRATGTEWDDANVGNYSAAFGTNTIASGENAFAVGGSASAANDNAIAFGSGASASAAHAFAIGDMQVSNHSFGVALGFSAGTQPNVSGANSIGLFMGDQSGQTLSSANTMALMGGDIVVGSTQLDDTGTGNEDNRMFFDTSKGAFRAGVVTGTEWDDSNVGAESVAFGRNAEAIGDNTFAAGTHVAAVGNESFAFGNSSYAQSFATIAFGLGNSVSGSRSVSIGDSSDVSGTNSMAFGLGQDAGTTPIVSGDNSLGIFMGDQSGIDVTDNNTVSIMGASGGVGIGTVSPNASGLHIDTGGVLIRATDGANAARFLLDDSSGHAEMTLYSGAQVDTVKIDATGTSHFTGGSVGIGTDSPTDILTVSGDNQDISFYSHSNTAVSGIDTDLLRSRGTESTPSAVTADDKLGGLRFSGYDGTQYETSASIMAFVDTGATVGDEDLPTHMRFYTRNATDITNQERMRLDSDGNLGIGNTSPDVALDVTGDIEYTGTITDVSDQRLKENIRQLSASGNLIDRIAQIDTYSFTMKEDKNPRKEFGVMAQELEKIFPELVHTAKDEMGTKSVNYVGLIAPMIEATKELKTENNALKSELSELKTAQIQTNKSLAEISQQVELLNKVTHSNIGKASMEHYIMLILGLIGGGLFMMVIQRRKSYNG
ncbi:MAG: tail fiber domain-containing protein [Alphaproteobacteria bacterium]